MRFKAQVVFLGVDDKQAKDDLNKIYKVVSFLDTQKQVLPFFLRDKQIDEISKLKQMQTVKANFNMVNYNGNIRVYFEGIDA